MLHAAAVISIPAAEVGAIVTGIDIAPNLLDQTRARAAGDTLDIRLEEGDAEDLQFEEGAFDVVVSMFGAMRPGPRSSPASSPGYAGMEGEARWPAGRLPVSSESCSKSPASMFRRRPECQVRCFGAMKPPCASRLATVLTTSGWNASWSRWNFRLRCRKRSSSTAFITLRGRPGLKVIATRA